MLKILEGPPSGTPVGAVPTVQADGSTDYVVPAAGVTINDSATATSSVWSSSKTSSAIGAAVTTPADATTTSKGVVQLAGDLAGTAASPALAAVGTAATYGSSNLIPVITTDSKGRVTAVTTAPAYGSGPFFYDPVNGWAAYPSTVPIVLYSVGYPSAPAPSNVADNSVWFASS